MKRIGILGAGTWGMALARMLTVSGNDVLVWSAIEKEIDSLSTTRKHPNLPQMKIPDELRFTKSIEEVCKDKDILLFAVPSVFVRSTAAKARPYVADGQIIVDVAKGIEPDTLYTMTEILADELGKEGGPKGVRLVALSGPTHAEEVAIDLPTTIVSASKDAEAAAFVQEVFTNNVMRVYTNDDIKGVELSGAMKNVIALGVGISTGLGYGDNARAALITRGIAEIARLGVAMGCNVHTFYIQRIRTPVKEKINAQLPANFAIESAARCPSVYFSFSLSGLTEILLSASRFSTSSSVMSCRMSLSTSFNSFLFSFITVTPLSWMFLGGKREVVLMPSLLVNHKISNHHYQRNGQSYIKLGEC